MSDDEAQIRKLVSDWMDASRKGNVDRVLQLVTDDVVFLSAGREPMNKAEFASLSMAHSGDNAPTVDGTSQIQEIQVAGDWAFMWTKLSVTVTPVDSSPVTRAGHTLTVLKKDEGVWRLARDANMLSVKTS